MSTTADVLSQSFTDLINGDTPVLVDFYTNWCSPCKMQSPILNEVKRELGERLTIIKIDAELNPAAAIKYQVRGVPTLILFQRGKILWQKSGVTQAPQLIQIIENKIEG